MKLWHERTSRPGRDPVGALLCEAADRERNRRRAARHMVTQGLKLYYQSLLQSLQDNTPVFLDRLKQKLRDRTAGL